MLVRSGNMAVVEILKARSSQDPRVMHLLRWLHYFFSAPGSTSGFQQPGLKTTWQMRSPGILSCPQALTHPTPVPPQLWTLAVILEKIKGVLEGSPRYESRMLWAACCRGFFGFLHCGEFMLPDSTPFDHSLHT